MRGGRGYQADYPTHDNQENLDWLVKDNRPQMESLMLRKNQTKQETNKKKTLRSDPMRKEKGGKSLFRFANQEGQPNSVGVPFWRGPGEVVFFKLKTTLEGKIQLVWVAQWLVDLVYSVLCDGGGTFQVSKPQDAYHDSKKCLFF